MIRALVIDDDPDFRTVTALALRLDRAFVVETAASARDALAMLSADCPRFDIVLVSATTPSMDGALIESIRRRSGCDTTPIAFLTRPIAAGERERYRAMGAVDVVTVPFDPIEFANEIRSLLALPTD